MPRYGYAVEGTASDGQTWTTTGEVDYEKEGGFPVAVQEAMRLSFEQLTQGRAVYGHPGVGCRGPYTIQRLLVERKDGA